jgi:uncharacterized protein involved in exopolysaccharide biosynthesis
MEVMKRKPIHNDYVPAIEPVPVVEEPVRRLDAWEIANALWRGRAFIATGALLAASAALTASLMVSKKYEAIATVFITPPTFSTELKAPPFSVEAYARLAESDFITASTIVEARRRNILGPLEEPVRLQAALYPSREPQKPYLPMLGLAGRSTSPEKAQALANVWAEILIKEERKMAALGKTASVDFILAEYPKAAERLILEEEKLRTLHDMQAKEVNNTETVLALPLRKQQLASRETLLVDLQAQLYKLRVDIQEASDSVAAIKTELETTPRVLATTKTLSDDALMALLAQKKGDAASNTAGQLHSEEVNPVHVSLSEKLATQRTRLASLQPREALLQQQVSTLRAEVDGLRAAIGTGQLQIEMLKGSHKAAATPIERAVTEMQSRYKRLEEKIGEAQLARVEEESNVKIGALAELPRHAYSPQLVGNVAVALMIGSVLGAIAAWVVSQRDNELASARFAGR